MAPGALQRLVIHPLLRHQAAVQGLGEGDEGAGVGQAEADEAVVVEARQVGFFKRTSTRSDPQLCPPLPVLSPQSVDETLARVCFKLHFIRLVRACRPCAGTGCGGVCPVQPTDPAQ